MAMHVSPAPLLLCPHDAAPLTLRGATYSCTHGHSFDRAREGYVNLLPVGDKASRDPGDSKEMVAARRRFLDTEAYAAIAAALADAALAHITSRPQDRAFAILDAGCGEGTYLHKLATRLATAPGEATIHLTGIDISKWAVRAAAKRAAPVTWIVASNRRPPLPPASVDLILCVFGFPIWPGFAAVQPTGGCVILADPGPDHLLELREIIYSEVQRHDVRPIADASGYTQIDEQRVTAREYIARQAAIADLLSMTPHAHRAAAAGRLALAKRTTLDITIDVVLRTFRKWDADTRVA